MHVPSPALRGSVERATETQETPNRGPELGFEAATIAK